MMAFAPVCHMKGKDERTVVAWMGPRMDSRMATSRMSMQHTQVDPLALWL